MVSVWWALLAFVAGAIFGMLIAALLTAGGGDGHDRS